MEQIGSVVLLPDQIQDNYSLIDELIWTRHYITKVADMYSNINYSAPIKEVLQWVTFHPDIPNTPSNTWSFSVINIFNEVVVVHLRIGGSLLTLVRILPLLVNIPDARNKNTMFKEAIRRVNVSGFSHGLMYYIRHCAIKPVVSLVKWEYDFSSNLYSPLPHSPTTPGWRMMTSSDISSVMTLTMQAYVVGRSHYW